MGLCAALESAVSALVWVPLVMRKPYVLSELIHSVSLETADWTCNLCLRVNVGFVSLKKKILNTFYRFGGKCNPGWTVA